MATIRNGKKAVVLVVDMQNAVVQSAHERERTIENINILVSKARDYEVPVIWVQHSDDELKENSRDWEIVPDLAVAKGDHRIHKHYNSSFERTGLDDLLKELGATEIVLAGAATNWCLRSSAYAALERGYDLSLIRDGHTTESMDLGQGKIIQAEDIITELNIAMSYVSYAGVVNRAVSAKDYRFD